MLPFPHRPLLFPWHPACCLTALPQLQLQIHLLVCLLATLHTTKVVTPLLPFATQSLSCASDVAIQVTKPPHAVPLPRVTPNAPSSLKGSQAAWLPKTQSKSVCSSMFGDPAKESAWHHTAITSALSAGMLTIPCVPAHEIDLDKVLYIVSIPYIASAWNLALATANLTSQFPKLVHGITYGSPIGNPPPLLHMFIPKNLASADFLPNIIDQELLDETAAGCMSGPFTVSEASCIFCGHFHTAPVGLIEKVPGDGNWRMIRHLSKTDHLGFSTNDSLDSDDFPTSYFSATIVVDWVSPFSWCRSFFSMVLVVFLSGVGCLFFLC